MNITKDSHSTDRQDKQQHSISQRDTGQHGDTSMLDLYDTAAVELLA